MHHTHTKRCFSRKEYIQYLADFADNAQKEDTIILATMSFKPSNPLISALCTKLIAAVDRGARVTVLIDAYAFMAPERCMMGPLWYPRYLRRLQARPFKQKSTFVEHLEKVGGTVILTNEPTHAYSLPMKGRSHMKFAVLNEDVFLGGCNLSDPEQVDCMIIRRSDEEIATWLRMVVEKTIKEPFHNLGAAMQYQDQTIALHDGSSLLFDCGRPNTSTIYKVATQMLLGAKKRIFMTCQYPIHGLPLKILKSFHRRNQQTRLFFNTPSMYRFPRNLLMTPHYIILRLTLPDIARQNALHMHAVHYLHAKVLIADEEMLIGSHNFIGTGVYLGTAEIALRSSDKDLIHEVQTCLFDQMKLETVAAR